MRKLRVLYASSEVAGFAKTGGLADVSSSLPRALAKAEIEPAVIMPLYRACRQAAEKLELLPPILRIAMGPKVVEGRLWRGRLHGSNVPILFVEQPSYFERDDPHHGSGLYQRDAGDGRKVDYPDNGERFVFFCRAILEALAPLDYWPDLVHVNDWQTGLVPIFLQEHYALTGRPVHRARYGKIRTVFTIHNLAYQGVFPKTDWPLLGLPWRYFNFEQLEFHDHISFLKAGIVFADALTTVSPTYAREIQTVYYGCGLQGILLRRSRQLTGIVNGIDNEAWNPLTDHHLSRNYDESSLIPGKAACKRDLQRQLGLIEDAHAPLLGVVSRLASQKGLDLLAKLTPRLIKEGAQLAILGLGDPALHQAFTRLHEIHPGKVGLRFALDESLAHRIEAGADIFLMPSQYEPCGLNQLYSLRYGTVPVVRATGGLADTVVDATPQNLAAGRATGFAFVPFSAAAFLEAIQRALTLRREQPQTWQRLQITGMRQDWTWNRSAGEYQKLYREVVSRDSM